MPDLRLVIREHSSIETQGQNVANPRCNEREGYDEHEIQTSERKVALKQKYEGVETHC
jgi:hypothetical protein